MIGDIELVIEETGVVFEIGHADLVHRGSGLHPDVLIIKSADQEVTTTSTAVEEDTELFIPVQPNEIWRVDARLELFSPEGGLRAKWAFPEGTVAMNVPNSTEAWQAGTNMVTSEPTSVVNNAPRYLHLSMLVRIGDTAGNIQFRFGSSSGTNVKSICRKGSMLMAWKVS